MASDHTTILAVGLALGLFLLLVLALLLFIFLGFRNLQSELSSSKFSEHVLEQNLAKYTAAGKRELPQHGDVSTDDLSDAAVKYWGSWNTFRLTRSSPHECPDTMDRIENLISPKSRLLPHTRGEDFTIFPNPHHYTAAEIFKLLQNPTTRDDIMTHIICSVVEKYTSLTPVWDVAAYSLLPFDKLDIIDLCHLRSRLLGTYWFGNLNGYIDRFTLGHRIHRAPGNPEREFIRSFFEELFGPYYGECSPEQIAERNRNIEKFLDHAVTFGYLAASVAGETVHVWGERQEGHIRVLPTLQYKMYTKDGHQFGPIMGEGLVVQREL